MIRIKQQQNLEKSIFNFLKRIRERKICYPPFSLTEKAYILKFARKVFILGQKNAFQTFQMRNTQKLVFFFNSSIPCPQEFSTQAYHVNRNSQLKHTMSTGILNSSKSCPKKFSAQAYHVHRNSQLKHTMSTGILNCSKPCLQEFSTQANHVHRNSQLKHAMSIGILNSSIPCPQEYSTQAYHVHRNSQLLCRSSSNASVIFRGIHSLENMVMMI